jgi:hypothetical protein
MAASFRTVYITLSLLCEAQHSEFGDNRRQTQQSRLESGCVATVDSRGQTIWIVDAHRDGKRFVMRADEKLTAFLELERVIRAPKLNVT